MDPRATLPGCPALYPTLPSSAGLHWSGVASTDKGGGSLRSQETRISNEPALPSLIASSMPVSRIREIMELAWEDPQVIHLEVGEPDFPTPSHIVDAAHEAARAGHTRYAPNAGLPELREALAEKVIRRNGYEARPQQVVVTQGGHSGALPGASSPARTGR